MSTNEDDGEKKGNKSDYNPKLDFLSDQFDPLLALNTPGVVVPVPSAKTYDNIGVYKSAQNKLKPQEKKPEMQKSEAGAGQSMSSEAKATIIRRWQPHQMPIPTIKREITKNVFTRMEEFTEGPLALLKQCVDQRLKIKVFTRRAHELRGHCIGYISLFDKHWNMVLEDVYEEWEQEVKLKQLYEFEPPDKVHTFKPLVDPPEIQKVLKDKVRGEKRRQTCYRMVKCVLMRGEHVSHISVLDKVDKKS